MNAAQSGPLKTLLIGGGGIAAAHLPGFETYPDLLRVVGCSDPCAPACDALAHRMEAFGQVRTFADHRVALRELAGEVEAALILTPHHLHFPAALDCLGAGLHVLIEKPVTNTLAQAEELAVLAEAKGLTAMAGQTRRFDPRYHYLRNWLREDPARFGALRSFEMCGWQNIEAWIATKPDRTDDFWILDKERAGGGVVISLLVHAIDLLRFLFDEDYAEVSARGRFDPPFKNGAESSCCALLTTRGGATGTLHANYLARKTPYSESVKFFGDQGCIGDLPAGPGSYSGPAFHGTTGGKPADGWDFQYSDVLPLPAGLPGNPTHNAFINQLLAFERSVRTGAASGSSIHDNLNTLATIEAIYQSMAQDGARVRVNPSGIA